MVGRKVGGDQTNFSGLDIKIIRGLAKSFAWGKARGLLNVSTIREPNAGRRA